MKFVKRILVGLSVLLGLNFGMMAVFPAVASAHVEEACTSSFLGFPVWYKYLEHVHQADGCNVELPKVPDDPDRTDWGATTGRVAAAVIEILLRVAALVAVGFVLYGGVQYIISQGEPDRLTAARNTIVNALIGLVIALVATVLVTFVAGRF